MEQPWKADIVCIFFKSATQKKSPHTCIFNFSLYLHPCSLLLISNILHFPFNFKKKVNKTIKEKFGHIIYKKKKERTKTNFKIPTDFCACAIYHIVIYLMKSYKLLHIYSWFKKSPLVCFFFMQKRIKLACLSGIYKYIATLIYTFSAISDKSAYLR